MPDIREVLDALDTEDRRLYSQTRTRMRGAYLQALTEIVGIHRHDETDDALLDLIDIKVAVLFDRAGRIAATKDVIAKDDAAKAEADIKDAAGKIQMPAVKATSLPKNGWDTHAT